MSDREEPFYRVRPGTQPDAPLLVLLHGYGSDENDLFGLSPYLDPRFALLSIRAPRRYPPGYGWYDVTFTEAGISVDETHLPDSAEGLLALLEQAKAEKIALIGFSQGAAVALYLLLTRPERFVGAAALSGHVPETGWRHRAPDDALSGKPIFVAHGTRDAVVPVAAGRDAREKLSALPVQLVYKEYAMAHEISGETLSDLVEWLKAL